MAAAVENRCRSLESSILFMQQEHAETLKGLHQEIQKLQKKCSELNFKIAMEAVSLPDTVDYKTRSEELQSVINKKDGDLKESQDEIEKRDKRIETLEQQLKAQEKKFTGELKNKKQIIQKLNSELDSKASNIVYLTKQYHELMTKIKDGKMNQVPTPPKESAPKMGRRRAVKPTDGGSQPALQTVKVRPASGRKLPERADTPDSMPDPTPFLPPSSQFRVSESMVLPPIGTSFDQGGSPRPVPPQQTKSNAFVKRHATRSSTSRTSSTEVETLAVQEMCSRQNSLRRAQEYNSTDS